MARALNLIFSLSQLASHPGKDFWKYLVLLHARHGSRETAVELSVSLSRWSSHSSEGKRQ